jgi:hypothetical protein
MGAAIAEPRALVFGSKGQMPSVMSERRKLLIEHKLGKETQMTSVIWLEFAEGWQEVG